MGANRKQRLTQGKHSPKPGPASRSLAQIVEQAVAAYRQGDLAEAERLCQVALEAKPDYFDALRILGIIALRTRRMQAAVDYLSKAVAINRGNAAAYSNLGTAQLELKDYESALASYGCALKLDPDDEIAHYNRGNALRYLKRYEAALDSYDRALKINPGNVEFMLNRGNALRDLQRYEEALASYRSVLKSFPDYAEVHGNCAAVLLGLKRWEEALGSCERALALKPDYAEAHLNRGSILRDLKRYEEALASYDRALAINPEYAEVCLNRGNVLRDLKRCEEAIASYERALAINPEYAEAHLSLGFVLQGQERHDDAQASYGRALAINPEYAEAHLNRGSIFQAQERYDEALASYDRSLEINPAYAEAFFNRGITLLGLWRYEEALASYDRALEINPEYAEACLNRGNVLRDLKRSDEALASYDHALEIKPDYSDVYLNRGNVLYELKRHEEALASYARALEIRPESEFIYGSWLHQKMWVCDWAGLSEAVLSLIDDVSSDRQVSQPFPILALSDSLSLQRRAAEIWVKSKAPASDGLPALEKRARGAKIRLGYYSADFHNHATAHLMAGLFERHDRSRFELIAFSFGPNMNDEMRGRVAAAFDRFIDVSKHPDRDVSLLSRELGVDIAVDLKGFTTDSRPGIFAYRAAPIQVNYLGYPGTMGAQYIDYLIADRTLIPAEARQHYSEKIAYLPHSYQVNDSKRRIAERVFTRAEAGLPETGFVFCCFNNNYKITLETFDGWMRLLERVEGSVLWLLEDNPTAARNLRREAQARGIDADRLVFAGRLPLDEHLARHRLADLFLDTLPCNAHTTASDALWVGLPVLTCTGETFASRVAASLLNAIGLSELITSTQREYESLAIALATNTERLSSIRQRLSDNRLTAPLFDTPLFTAHIEDAYQQMFERYHADLPSEHLYVQA